MSPVPRSFRSRDRSAAGEPVTPTAGVGSAALRGSLSQHAAARLRRNGGAVLRRGELITEQGSAAVVPVTRPGNPAGARRSVAAYEGAFEGVFVTVTPGTLGCRTGQRPAAGSPPVQAWGGVEPQVETPPSTTIAYTVDCMCRLSVVPLEPTKDLIIAPSPSPSPSAPSAPAPEGTRPLPPSTPDPTGPSAGASPYAERLAQAAAAGLRAAAGVDEAVVIIDGPSNAPQLLIDCVLTDEGDYSRVTELAATVREQIESLRNITFDTAEVTIKNIP